jgi:hypothetical protein
MVAFRVEGLGEDTLLHVLNDEFADVVIPIVVIVASIFD